MVGGVGIGHGIGHGSIGHEHDRQHGVGIRLDGRHGVGIRLDGRHGVVRRHKGGLQIKLMENFFKYFKLNVLMY
jgi:hypothetical protein